MNGIGNNAHRCARENRNNWLLPAPALRFAVSVVLAAALSGCATLPPPVDKNQSGFVQLPLIAG